MRTHLCSHAFAGALLLFLCCGAPSVHARTAVVAPDGSGDFTSIQAAIDDLFAHRPLGDPLVPPDTAIVLAGFYDESIQSHTDEYFTVLRLECPAGPVATRVRALQYPTGAIGAGIPAEFADLGIAERIQAGSADARYVFERCRLEGGLMQDVGNVSLVDCTVLGRSQISATGSGVVGGRFIGAPVSFTGAPDLSWSTVEGVTFEGPCDTLVLAQPDGYPGIGFYDCTFRNAAIGLSKGPVGGSDVTADGLRVDQCRFENLATAAIAADLSPLGLRRYPGIVVYGSRVTNCGRALDWRSAGRVQMEADTLQTTAYPAIRIRTAAVELLGLVMAPGTGGIAVHLEPARGDNDFLTHGLLDIRRCSMSGLPGPAITLIDSLTPPSFYTRTIRENVIRDCGADGMVVSSAGVTVLRNVVSGCSGAGVRIEMLGSAQPIRVESNSLVANRGDGLVLQSPNLVTTPRRITWRNLAAFNRGVGIRLNGPLPGSTGYNDAWQNDAGDYAGVASPLDSNLVVDPQLCDLHGGVYTLKFGSPCGAAGVYGLIGALPEACSQQAGAPAPSPLAFSLHPNPARGSVAFTPPATGADGTIEVLDVAGRRVWSAAFRAGAPPIVWHGESARGALDAGLYWARVVRPGESATRRLVWLK